MNKTNIMEPLRGTSEEAVYEKIKNAIKKRYIKQGSQLVEGSLAQNLGVSRTPVRIAIKRLESEGLVNTIPNRGAFVITPTLQEIQETFQVRTQLEEMAAKLTAQVITPEQIDELNQLIELEKNVFNNGDLGTYYEVNETFHLKIAEFSGNKVLTSYVRELIDRTSIFLILFDPFAKLAMSPSLISHQEIVDALALHNPAISAAAIASHIQSSVEDLEHADLMPEDYLAI